MPAPFYLKLRVFKKFATCVFLFFMGLMCFVTYVAYSRKSGSTGLDMGKVQQMRSVANHQDDAKKSNQQP